MDLESIFTADHVIYLESDQKQLAVKELVQKLHSLGKISSVPRYYAQVVHRESSENTGIGSGFAIPHARTDSVDDFIVAFGVSKSGIDYGSYDGKPVKYIMLSIFPTSKSTKYLFVISMLATVFSDPLKVELLDNASSEEEVYNILKENAEHYFDNISDVSEDQINPESALAGVPNSDLDLLIKLDRLTRLMKKNPSDSIKEKVDGIRELIDNRSLTYYDRMSTKCENPFAIVEKNACSGCHMNIPPVEMNEIQQRNKISICSHCGRFLIFL